MLVVIGMFLNVHNFENCSRMQVRKHVFTNTQLRKSSRMTRPNSGWNFIISRTGMLWNGKHRTYFWSHSDRIRNSAKSKRSNVRWKIHRIVFDHWRKMARISALPLHNILFTIPGSFFWDSMFQTESRVQCFFISYENFRERVLIHCGFRSCISYDDKGPPVIVIATCTTRNDRRSNIICQWFEHVCWFSVLERITRRALAGNICARRVVLRMGGGPGQPSYLIKKWR